MNALPRHNGARSDYGEHEVAIVRYREEGTRRALAMKNRGPLSIDENGKVSQEILDAYNEFGFYVFEGVISKAEAVRSRIRYRRYARPSAISSGIKG